MSAQIINLSYPEPGIAVVEMADRETRNTFSRELIKGICNAFAEIKLNQAVKTVLIHGYDNYFCCGGTQEELMNIFSGKLINLDILSKY